MTGRALGPHVLDLDLAAEVDRICGWMVDTVANRLKRRGVIIAMSGGIDSSVCAALAVRAFGAGKVYGILLPERFAQLTQKGRLTYARWAYNGTHPRRVWMRGHRPVK